MKTIKYIGFSLLSLILIFVLFGYFQPSKVSVSRTILVNAPISSVFDQFNDMDKRVKWSPWEELDSTMVSVVGDVSKGAGASYSWTSENSGTGTIKYKEVVENQLIESQLYFDSPENEPAQGLMIFAQKNDGVMVTWEVHMDLGMNPFMRIMGRFMDDMIGPTFDLGLKSVKRICESELANEASKYSDVKIQMIDVESVPYIGVKDSCALAELGDKIAADFASLGEYMGSHQLNSNGFARIVFHKFDPPTKVVFEPIFVLEKAITVDNDEFIVGNTYGGKVITATHTGPYEKSAHVWEALDLYLLNNGLSIVGTPWEEYENTPRDEPDAEKLVTNIYMPVQ